MSEKEEESSKKRKNEKLEGNLDGNDDEVTMKKKRMRTDDSNSTKDVDPMTTLNPKMVVKTHEFRRDDGKMISVNVFRDDVLEGGTKQRAMAVMIRDSKADRFVYAGPAEGYAQVALAYVCKLYGKKSTVVLPRRRDRRLHALTLVAKSHGVHVVEVPPRNNGNGVARLKDVQSFAEQMVKQHNDEKHEGDVMELLPFGLHCDSFVSELVQRLKKCIPDDLLSKNPPKRLWTVAGSAALLASFAKVWPETKFMVVQVGKKIWPDQIGYTKLESDGEGEFNGPRTFESELFIAPERFFDVAHKQPPYPTVRTYDAKLWQFVLKHAENGDYVWNVGRDRDDEVLRHDNGGHGGRRNSRWDDRSQDRRPYQHNDRSYDRRRHYDDRSYGGGHRRHYDDRSYGGGHRRHYDDRSYGRRGYHQHSSSYSSTSSYREHHKR
jgi:hypothetical protein